MKVSEDEEDGDAMAEKSGRKERESVSMIEEVHVQHKRSSEVSSGRADRADSNSCNGKVPQPKVIMAQSSAVEAQQRRGA